MPHDTNSALDVLTSSLADALASKAKWEDMKKRHGAPETPGYTQHVDPFRPDYEPSDAVRALRTKPLRIDIDFDDPIRTRQQLSIIGAALVRAMAISQDHDLGAYKQLAEMRAVLRMANIEVQHVRGRKNAGKND